MSNLDSSSKLVLLSNIFKYTFFLTYDLLQIGYLLSGFSLVASAVNKN